MVLPTIWIGDLDDPGDGDHAVTLRELVDAAVSSQGRRDVRLAVDDSNDLREQFVVAAAVHQNAVSEVSGQVEGRVGRSG